MTETTIVPAHDQTHTSHYVVHYPDHSPREGDPHYRDFHAYHERTKHDPAVYVCGVGKRRGDFSDCDHVHPLELHHAHVEFALANEVDLGMLEAQYPGISNPDEVGAWIETAENLTWLCQFHHRGHGGAHVASASDFEAQHYVKALIS